MSHLLETLRLHQPLPADLEAAAARRQRHERALAHYQAMAVQAMAERLQALQQPEPVREPGASYAVQRLHAAGAEWLCCVADSDDGSDAPVAYVLIGTKWLPAQDTLQQHVFEALCDDALRLQSQAAQWAREAAQERAP